jgi:hypothetical protein
MTPASGFRAVEAGRSGVPLRVVLALGVGAEDRSAIAGQAQQDRAVGRQLQIGSDNPMPSASGFRAVEAGRSGVPPRVVLVLAVGAEDESALRAARPSDVAAWGIPCKSGETEDARSRP